MNNEQRQLLAGEIDTVSRNVQALEEQIARGQKTLFGKMSRLDVMKSYLAKLQEGVDW